ncbi:helix-turn-helix transcriptional regulator [Streptomyces sp. NBRC 109706]|uniref:helix-turn-helix domain-containing protein n=1 Tax=Streptomyces sp. NBRC 109706 TaxID=1550035 RepID=UPI000785FEFD|nr:helix-turn-helix transcriptional regulator [Streptomyces sp. NBRC 109706]
MPAEHDGDDPTDPNASTLAHFGMEVRLERERHQVTQMDLAAEVPCHHTLVQKIETAKRVPSFRFAETCDRLFDAHGRFTRLWPLVIKYAFPAWFRPYVELEMRANSVRLSHPYLVPGLLQTEDYARAVLRAGRPRILDDLVDARMDRQRILERANAPEVWVILEEGVIHREVGGPSIMRGQLERLLTFAENPAHVIQIIPREVTVHAGSGGPFVILGFQDSGDVVHVDAFPRGHLLAEPDDVKASNWAYDLLKAVALSPDDSVSLLGSTLKEYAS